MSFLGSFFGSDQRSDLKKANKQATAAIDTGLQQGVGSYQQGQQRLDPYAQGGGQAFNAMMAAMGLQGQDAQQEFTNNYMASPTVDLQQQAVARQMAARGLTDSGASRLAAARVHQEGYDNNLNRMMQLGQQGQTAATGQATFDQGIGDMQFGTGQLKGNQAIGFGNAMAANRNVGVNNVMGAIGTAAKAFGAFA